MDGGQASRDRNLRMVVSGAGPLLQPGGQGTGAGSSEFQSKLCLFLAARFWIKSFMTLSPVVSSANGAKMTPAIESL